MPDEEKVETQDELQNEIEAEAGAEASRVDTEEAAGVAVEKTTDKADVEKGPTGAEKAAAYLQKFLSEPLPDFKPGDTVRVHYRIIEGTKERIQVFEGVVIAIKHAGLDKTFNVRKVSWNIGVERTFLYNSKKIDKVQIVRRGRVRRAKIYYLRDRIGKAARIKERRKAKTTNKV